MTDSPFRTQLTALPQSLTRDRRAYSTPGSLRRRIASGQQVRASVGSSPPRSSPLPCNERWTETIEVPHRLVRPRRFDITVRLKGVTWRRVQIEVSPDEGRAGSRPELIAAPSLAGFGLPTPDGIASLSLAYQIAQKVHACTDPHDPPATINDRARDVVVLLLLRDLAAATGSPSSIEIRATIEDVFAARAAEAILANAIPRH